jgi:hypothetical protein
MIGWSILPSAASSVFERTADGNYQKLVGAISGRVDPVPGCAGLALDIDALWAELERLGGEEAVD